MVSIIGGEKKMISVCDDCEYTVTIADLIETLAGLDKYLLRIWVTVSELPFVFNQGYDLNFLQESIRIQRGNVVEYIFYDLISYVRVINES